MEETIVKVDHLSHRYSVQWAIRDINFEVPKHGIYGLLGSNGAGKSTTMNIMCGVLRQSEGDVYIKGISMSKNPVEAKRHIGFLPQNPPLHMDLTVTEYLEYCAALRYIPDREIPQAVKKVLERCGISHFSKRLLRNLSGGYQQRVGIAQAIIHNPDFVVLDEPTNGLDPNQILDVRHLIKEIAEEHTVLISTHILSEVQAVCDHIRMIEQGRLVFAGTVEEFDNYIVPDSLFVSLMAMPAIEDLKRVPGVLDVEELLGITDLLQSLHIPCRIITERTEDYSGLKALIAANADYLPDTEYEKFRRFTASGGLFIATGSTSRFNDKGQYSGNFILADVFGVNDSGRDTETCSYMALPDRFLSSDGISPLATASTAKVHAFVNLPDFPVNDPVHYASIHSNPPGKTTVFAGLTEHQYGRGKCFRFHSNLLGIRRHSQQEFSRNFLRAHLPPFVTESENLPNSTEITLLKSTTSDSLLLGIVNYQEELPNIPLLGIHLTIRLAGQDKIRKIIRASDGREVAFRQENGLLSFEIPRLENGEILELQK